MTGSDPAPDADPTWYRLVDLATDRVVGTVRRNGDVRSDDSAVIDRVAAAFRRELFLRDGAVIEELGVCYADVVTQPPGAPDHRDLVFRNLALLTGYLPAEPEDGPAGIS